MSFTKLCARTIDVKDEIAIDVFCHVFVVGIVIGLSLYVLCKNRTFFIFEESLFPLSIPLFWTREKRERQSVLFLFVDRPIRVEKTATFCH
jgi:hypothetical protein